MWWHFKCPSLCAFMRLYALWVYSFSHTGRYIEEQHVLLSNRLNGLIIYYRLAPGAIFNKKSRRLPGNQISYIPNTRPWPLLKSDIFLFMKKLIIHCLYLKFVRFDFKYFKNTKVLKYSIHNLSVYQMICIGQMLLWEKLYLKNYELYYILQIFYRFCYVLKWNKLI